MPLAEKGVRGKGRQPLSPPQHTGPRSANSAPDLHKSLASFRQANLPRPQQASFENVNKPTQDREKKPMLAVISSAIRKK